MALLENFLTAKVLEPNYAYCDDENVGKMYMFPSGDEDYQNHIERISAMPTEEIPQIFGFHPNADISKNLQQAKTLTEMLMGIGEVDGVTFDDSDVDS